MAAQSVPETMSITGKFSAEIVCCAQIQIQHVFSHIYIYNMLLLWMIQ